MTVGEVYAEAFPAKRYTGAAEDPVIPTEERYRLLGASKDRRKYLLGLTGEKTAPEPMAAATAAAPKTREEKIHEILTEKRVLSVAEYKPSTRTQGTAVKGEVHWFTRYAKRLEEGESFRWSKEKYDWNLWPMMNKPIHGGSLAEERERLLVPPGSPALSPTEPG